MSSFNEAPASATVKIQTTQGFEWMFTMRDERPASLIDKIKRFEAAAAKAGWRPATGSRQPQAQQGEELPQDGEFEIEEIIHSGKTSNGQSDVWRVKGGNFMTWGLPMYPEAWGESGYEIPPSDRRHSFKGWKAYFKNKKVKRIECPQLETTSTMRQEVEANPHKFAAWPEPPADSHYTDDEFPF